MQNNFKITGSDGQTYPLNALFTGGGTNNAPEFDYWKNKDSNGVMTNYITGKNNKGTYLSTAATPDGDGINGSDSTGTSLGYLESEINNWNDGFGLDSCTFTDYKGPVGSGGITANYLGAYFINYTSTVSGGTTTSVPTWCDYIIIVMVGGGGGGGSNWTNDDSYAQGGGGGGGGYVISRSFNLIENDIKKLNVIVGSGGLSYASSNHNGQNGFSSAVSLVDSNNVTQVIVRGTGGGGGNVDTNTSGCKGGKGSSYSITNNTTSTWPQIKDYMVGFNGEDGYRADDNGSSWGSRAGKWGAESVVGMFYDAGQLNTYNTNAYGRGGKGSGLGNDNDDGASANPDGKKGGNGWVRIYFMRN
jgi:hypothetical protein